MKTLALVLAIWTLVSIVGGLLVGRIIAMGQRDPWD